ncbi:glycosyltransferase family 2 protein [Chryseolinea sp. H1M3-3]|uniref:glycosyltransferase family 2 protein n=1 Tax=Chryseolinea sp. H1M3-3 TaxID=3034144 RepID=UPI0023EDF1AB|nr:glycosyltransferase family 2 protein [Chryseolinea sp. H1M3-3]
MNDNFKKTISFVIPVYNEAENLGLLHKELCSTLFDLPYVYEFIFVDDGSADDSLAIIKRLTEKDSNIFYIELSRNFGHQHALKAGMDIAQGDCVISMDCDLQHPPQVVRQLIAKWEEGFDIVYTRRKEDKKLPRIKRKTSSLFYALLNKISDMKLENGTADFRLVNRHVLKAFSHLNENELFIRGLIKWAGFRQFAIDYYPRERYAGESKYDFRKMLSFAFRGITSFSVKPLKLIAYLGILLFLISMVLVPYALISYFIGKAVSGWTSLMISIIFFGSLQLLMIGIIGLYLGKLVIQAKQRPLYFIRDTNYSSNAASNLERPNHEESTSLF